MDSLRHMDLVVAGAGPAGIAAALTGARQGMRTLLLDAAGYLGGTVTACLHTSLCGLYSETPPRHAGDTLNGGMQAELASALAEQAPAVSRPERLGRVFVLPFDRARFRELLHAWLRAESRLTLRLSTAVTGVKREKNRIAALVLADGATVPCGAVIDCTGDAAVARFAGASLQPDDRDPAAASQLAGYGIYVRDLAGNTAMLPVAVPYRLRQAVEAGVLPEGAQYTCFAPGKTADEGVVKVAVPASCRAGPHELEGYISLVLRTMRERLPEEFAPAQVVETSPAAQPRIGPRLLGDSTLSEADIYAARKAPGQAGVRNAWPVELWSASTGPWYGYVPKEDWYEIPGACLRTARVLNLACAGRCISTTPRAAASVRAAGTCFALGELAARSLAE